MLERIVEFFGKHAAKIVSDERVQDSAKAVCPSAVVLSVIHTADLKSLAEMGLISLNAAYLLWRWHRDAKHDRRRKPHRHEHTHGIPD